MKEIIGIVVLIAMALGGNMTLKQLHDTVIRGSLKKASEDRKNNAGFGHLPVVTGMVDSPEFPS